MAIKWLFDGHFSGRGSSVMSMNEKSRSRGEDSDVADIAMSSIHAIGTIN